MPWFWGSKKTTEDDDEGDEEESHDEDYETDDEEEEEEDDIDENGSDLDDYDRQGNDSSLYQREEEGGNKDHTTPIKIQHNGEQQLSPSVFTKENKKDENLRDPKYLKTLQGKRQTQEQPGNNLLPLGNRNQQSMDVPSPSSATSLDNPNTELGDAKTYREGQEQHDNNGPSQTFVAEDNMYGNHVYKEGDEEELGELVLQGAIPSEVVGNRDRAASALSHDDMSRVEAINDDLLEDAEEVESVELQDRADDGNGIEGDATTMQDKQALLLLAAQYDRVDILNSVLSSGVGYQKHNDDIGDNHHHDEKYLLLHRGMPPLHVAIFHGSMNAINCLLRVGADPSIRPNLDNVSPEQIQSVPNARKFLHGVTCWEMVFGCAKTSNNKSHVVVNLPPSKKEGIRHAFCAEALRCIGSDEVTRLRQMLAAGVPPDLEMGGKSLYDWSVEMGAPNCEAALRPSEAAKYPMTQECNELDGSDQSHIMTKKHNSAVLDRPSGNEETISSLENRVEELESLARALSNCLDNLAEEVSVCHGLLLMGGGAAALAAHVKSLKATQERKLVELERLQEAYKNTQDEMEYWVQEAGPKGKEIAHQFIAPASTKQTTNESNQHTTAATTSTKDDQSSAQNHRRSVLLAQLSASETKVRKLRVSIADLSEENVRNLVEVERRGLTGGITLVRNLRDDIRELEFQLSQLKYEESACRTKISILQKTAKSALPLAQQSMVQTNILTASTLSPERLDQPRDASETLAELPSEETEIATVKVESTMTDSQRIERGQSTAIAIVGKGGRGFFTATLWQILLRIIGIRDPATRMSRSAHSDSSSSNHHRNKEQNRKNVQPAIII